MLRWDKQLSSTCKFEPTEQKYRLVHPTKISNERTTSTYFDGFSRSSAHSRSARNEQQYVNTGISYINISRCSEIDKGHNNYIMQ
jgi:hypothetical protein